MAPSTTATRFVGLLALTVLLPAEAPAGGDVERVVRDVQASSVQPLPSLADVTQRCASDPVCAARVLAQAMGPNARLEAVHHPSTDQIRWAKSASSIAGKTIDEHHVLTVELARFGRKAALELGAVLADGLRPSTTVVSVVIDLRANSGGDFHSMLRVASLFTGPVPGAVRLIGRDKITEVSVPRGDLTFHGTALRVLVGSQTASSAEVLAALLKVHAGAQVFGATTYGKDYILRVVPVSHDWRLLVPAERIEVPGITLAGGLIPDVEVAGGE